MEIRKTFHAVFITIIFILASFQAAYAIGEGFTYDANGNMIQGPDGLYYEYNNANQLKRVRDGGPTGEVIAEYWYDYTGKRIKKNESGVVTYYWFEDFEQIYYPNGTIVNITYYSANGERLAKKVSTAAGDKMYYFHPDHLGSTSIVSDEDGNLVEKTEYYPYGGVKQGGTQEKYQFTGKELDKATGLYDYGARQYHPDLARFVQPDNIIPDPYDPQQLNRYTYARDNPLKYKDSTGHYIESAVDVAFIAYDIRELRQDSGNVWNWVALGADLAGLALPGITGGGVVVRAVKGGGKAVSSANQLNKLYDTARVPQAYRGVKTYGEWTKIKQGKNTGLQAHKLVEIRFFKDPKLAKDMPAINLPPGVHSGQFTKEFYKRLPYGQRYTKDEVLKAIDEVYAKQPELHKAAREFVEKHADELKGA